MNDSQIREALVCHCSQANPPLPIHELGIHGGWVRADYACLSRSLFTGYEIKSAVDSLTRLPNQVACYSDTFDVCYLVLDDEGKHFHKAIDIIPPWWGVLICGNAGVMSWARDADKNPNPSIDGALWLLWKDEIVAALKCRGITKGLSGRNKGYLRNMLGESIGSRREATETVFNALVSRDSWRS